MEEKERKFGEFLLPEQSSMKVVLNGGNRELDDATVPFTIGFNEKIANMEPTHVLVIDYHEKNTVGRNLYDLGYLGTRTLYKLNKINYIQFNKPGKHNLIFILLRISSKEEKNKLLHENNYYNQYENRINICYIEDGYNICDGYKAYAETVVEIPKEFFATEPESGIKKIWYSWVNGGFRQKPINECDFRNRAIYSVTIKPIIMLLGFILRLIVSIVMVSFITLINILYLLGGVQAKKESWKNVLKIAWDFLFLYPKESMSDIWRSDLYFDHDFDIKHHKIGEWEFKLPISVFGLIIQIFLWGTVVDQTFNFYQQPQSELIDFTNLLKILVMLFIVLANLFFIIGTTPYKIVENWFKNNFYKGYLRKNYEMGQEFDISKFFKIFFILSLIPIISFLVTQIEYKKTETSFLNMEVWVIGFISFLVSLFFLIFGLNIIEYLKNSKLVFVIKNQLEEIRVQKMKAIFAKQNANQDTYSDFLIKNMNINNLPDKVDTSAIVARTTTEQTIQRFKVAFWAAKAKVCKPYAR